MTVQDKLDQLRQKAAGSRLTAFGDLSSRLILRYSARDALPREELDRLCERAIGTFEKGDAIADHLPQEFGALHHCVINFTSKETALFARVPTEPDDVTVAVIDAAHEILAPFNDVQHTADTIGGDAE